MIAENLRIVEQGICSACEAAGRRRDEVKLIAVSKTKPESDILEAYRCGIRDFGENKVQELLRKKEVLPEDIRWHLIGHLQTNKVRQIVGNSCLIHSVDSVRLADTIDTESAKKGIVTDALLEVNVGREPTKYGFAPEIDAEVLERFAQYRHLRIRGLMTVAPAAENPMENAAVFRCLRLLAVDIAAKNIDNMSMDFLSMGMTGDYAAAIQEGATFVRIGTAIFGSRVYKENENGSI